MIEHYRHGVPAPGKDRRTMAPIQDQRPQGPMFPLAKETASMSALRLRYSWKADPPPPLANNRRNGTLNLCRISIHAASANFHVPERVAFG